MLLIMTVEPGFGGQTFLDLCLPKIRAARAMLDKHGIETWIQVDGGISARHHRAGRRGRCRRVRRRERRLLRRRPRPDGRRPASPSRGRGVRVTADRRGLRRAGLPAPAAPAPARGARRARRRPGARSSARLGGAAARCGQDPGRPGDDPARGPTRGSALPQHSDPGPVGPRLARLRQPERRRPGRGRLGPRPRDTGDRPDLPVAGGLRRRAGGGRRRESGAHLGARPPPRQRQGAGAHAAGGRADHAGARRVPPPARGLGPAAGRAPGAAARRHRAGPDRDPCHHADPRPGGAGRPAVRRRRLLRVDPGGGARGTPGAVRRPDLADHALGHGGPVARRPEPAVRRAHHRSCSTRRSAPCRS